MDPIYKLAMLKIALSDDVFYSALKNRAGKIQKHRLLSSSSPSTMHDAVADRLDARTVTQQARLPKAFGQASERALLKDDNVVSGLISRSAPPMITPEMKAKALNVGKFLTGGVAPLVDTAVSNAQMNLPAMIASTGLNFLKNRLGNSSLAKYIMPLISAPPKTAAVVPQTPKRLQARLLGRADRAVQAGPEAMRGFSGQMRALLDKVNPNKAEGLTGGDLNLSSAFNDATHNSYASPPSEFGARTPGSILNNFASRGEMLRKDTNKSMTDNDSMNLLASQIRQFLPGLSKV